MIHKSQAPSGSSAWFLLHHKSFVLSGEWLRRGEERGCRATMELFCERRWLCSLDTCTPECHQNDAEVKFHRIVKNEDDVYQTLWRNGAKPLLHRFCFYDHGSSQRNNVLSLGRNGRFTGADDVVWSTLRVVNLMFMVSWRRMRGTHCKWIWQQRERLLLHNWGKNGDSPKAIHVELPVVCFQSHLSCGETCAGETCQLSRSNIHRFCSCIVLESKGWSRPGVYAHGRMYGDDFRYAALSKAQMTEWWNHYVTMWVEPQVMPSLPVGQKNRRGDIRSVPVENQSGRSVYQKMGGSWFCGAGMEKTVKEILNDTNKQTCPW